MVTFSYSLSAQPPPFTFCLEATCLASIDGCLLPPVVYDIPHNNLCCPERQKPLNSDEWESLWLKTATWWLIVTRSCGHLDKLGVWGETHMTNFFFISFAITYLRSNDVWTFGPSEYKICVETVFWDQGWHSGNLKWWSHCQLTSYIQPFPVPSLDQQKLSSIAGKSSKATNWEAGQFFCRRLVQTPRVIL